MHVDAMLVRARAVYDMKWCRDSPSGAAWAVIHRTIRAMPVCASVMVQQRQKKRGGRIVDANGAEDVRRR